MPDRADRHDDEIAVGIGAELSARRAVRVSTSNLLILLFAVALAASGQVVLKHGMTLAKHHAKTTGKSLFASAALSPWIIAGLAIFAVSALAWLLILSRVPLSQAYPFNAVGYLGILLASVLFLNERANAWTWIGTLLVATGLILVVTMAPGSS